VVPLLFFCRIAGKHTDSRSTSDQSPSKAFLQFATSVQASLCSLDVADAVRLTDEVVLSRRMATRQGAKQMGGFILQDTKAEIDDSQLEQGQQWTPIDFRPRTSATV
jgi:hypothetical protein